MGCLPKKVAIVERWPLVEVRLYFVISSHWFFGENYRNLSDISCVLETENSKHFTLTRS